MGEKFKKFIQEQSNKEADAIMELVNQDPEMADVHAPDEMGEALFARIAEYENAKAEKESKLSKEDKELIELGKIYKKRRKAKKYVVAALVAILAMSFGGITVMGGPEKVIEVVEKWIAGGNETRVNSDDERIEGVANYTEEEAYAKIEEEFGFVPVHMLYIPDGMEFAECEIYRVSQCINLVYEYEDKSIICMIRPNYKVNSTGIDTEDILLKSYTNVMEGVVLNIEKYQVKESGEKRCFVEFKYNNVYYFFQMYNLEEIESEKVIDNLYFPN